MTNRSYVHILLSRIITVCIVANAGVSLGDEPTQKVDRSQRAIVFVEHNYEMLVKGTPPDVCSGFCVKDGTSLYLVSVKGGISRLGLRRSVGVVAGDQTVKWCDLQQVIDPDDPAPWKDHPNADVTVARVARQADKDFVKELTVIAISLAELSDRELKPGDVIEMVGFPAILLPTPKAAAPSTVLRSFVAAGERRSPAIWPMRSYCLASPPGAEGVNGGPVFLTTKEEDGLLCVGSYYGVPRTPPVRNWQFLHPSTISSHKFSRLMI